MRVLRERGAVLAYHDPYVPSLPALDLESGSLDETTAGADAIVLVTAHPGIDHGAIARDATLFVDLRGATRGDGAANVVRL
jgi:UDP-N-acetyl-D-glucosamine dehydrogenase